MDNTLTAIAIVSSSAASLLLAALNQTYLSAAAFLVSAAAFIASRRTSRNPRQFEYDTAQFLDNLIRNSSISKSTMKVLTDSLNPRFVFYNDLATAIDKYRKGSATEYAFSGLEGKGPVLFQEVLNTITRSLDDGFQPAQAFAELKQGSSAKDAYAGRNRVSISGANSLVRMGSTVFFPAFAGISIDIIRFTSTQGPHLAQLALLLGSYILIANCLGGAFAREPASRAVGGAALYSALGILVFKVTSIIAMNTI